MIAGPKLCPAKCPTSSLKPTWHVSARVSSATLKRHACQQLLRSPISVKSTSDNALQTSSSTDAATPVPLGVFWEQQGLAPYQVMGCTGGRQADRLCMSDTKSLHYNVPISMHMHQVSFSLCMATKQSMSPCLHAPMLHAKQPTNHVSPNDMLLTARDPATDPAICCIYITASLHQHRQSWPCKHACN